MSTATTAVAKLTENKNFIEKALGDRIATLAELLPPDQVEQAPRLVRVAMLYFTRDPKVQECTPLSFIQCVFDSVASGIPLDGKLGHAVVFNTKVKHPDGKETWEKRVKFMPDFKGVVSVARRTKQILDAQSGLVYARDHWKHGRVGPQLVLEHTPADGERGELIGTYCILTFHDGGWNYEYMTKAEVDKVRASSKAANDGPWCDWYEQMARKTVLKRALKTYCDDPQLLAAVQADDDWHTGTTRQHAPRVQQSTITTLPKPQATGAIANAIVDQQEQRREAVEQAPQIEQQPEVDTGPLAKWKAAIDVAGDAQTLQAILDDAVNSDLTADQGAQVSEWAEAKKATFGKRQQKSMV